MKLSKKNAGIYAAIGILLVAGVAVGGNKSFSVGTAKGNGLAAASESKITVNTQRVKTLEKTASLSYKATLEPSEEAIVCSKLSGKVVEILFENGKVVSQGDPLVKIDDQDVKNNMASAQAQLAAAETQLKASENQWVAAKTGLQKLEVNLETVQRNYDRTKFLFDQNVISKVEMENSEAALKVAKTDLESAEVNAETARLSIETAKANVNTGKASIHTLHDALSDTVIRAPITGNIDEKAVSLGQFVSTGIVLAKVKNVSGLHAVIQVEQGNLKYIKEEMKAQIKLENPDAQSFEGTVKSIDLGADPSVRTFKCKISIDNKNMALRPGIFARVELSSDQKREAMVIPIQALSGSEGNYSVFTIQEGTAKKRSVSVGEISKDTAEILSGVQKDESIIVTNLNILQDGDPVDVSEQGE